MADELTSNVPPALEVSGELKPNLKPTMRSFKAARRWPFSTEMSISCFTAC